MGPRKDESQYVLYVSNLSSSTRSRDIKDEFEHTAGRVYKIERDYKSRSALVEMDKADDADYAFRKIDGLYTDGREWRVDYATKSDFKFYGWKWSEGGGADDANRSPSRSVSPQKEKKKPERSSRSRSPAPRRKSAGSNSPTTTKP